MSRCDQTRLSHARVLINDSSSDLMAFGSNDLLLEETPSSFGRAELLSLDTNLISEPSSPPTTEHILTPSPIEEDEARDSPTQVSNAKLLPKMSLKDIEPDSEFQSNGLISGCDFGTSMVESRDAV